MVAQQIIARHKYRKNRNNNKSKKIQDLEKEEAKERLEMSANVAKIAKVLDTDIRAPLYHFRRCYRNGFQAT